MIDLTPLDVRNKRGDFTKIMRGYQPDAVDHFLELVAERLEALIRENLKLRERTMSLQDQVSQLSAENLEALLDGGFDFRSVADLETWLAGHSTAE